MTIEHGTYGKNFGILLIFITAFLWSFLGVFDKFISVNGILVSGITSLLALPVLGLSDQGKRFEVSGRILLAAVTYAITTITFYTANKLTSVTNVIILQYCSPVFVLLFKAFSSRYQIRKREIVSVLICVLGLVVFFYDRISTGEVFGNLLALISGIMFGATFFLNAGRKANPAASMALGYLICALFAIINTFVEFLRSATMPAFTIQDIWLLCITGFIIVGVSTILYTKGIQLTGALTANLVAMSEVFMAPLWSVLFFKDHIKGLSLVGILLMISGTIMESRYEPR